MDIAALRNERDLLALVELSRPHDLAEALGLDFQVPLNHPVMADVLQTLVISAGQEVSGLVVDPDFGLPAYTTWIKDTKLYPAPGLVLSLESSAEASAPQVAATLPTISPEWGVEHIANNYALAFLELRYHPAEPESLAKKQLVAELFDFCQTEKTELVLKLSVGDQTGIEAGSEVQLVAVQELRASTHLLALEIPADPLATASLTAELDIPWIATPGPNQTFPQFSARLTQAIENGAQGYLIGQTAWGDISQIKRPDQGADINQVKAFINTTYRDRLQGLNQVLAETVQV